MKKVLLIIGIVLSGVSLYQVSQYILNYNMLSEYGKGYVWGSIILFLIGVILILLGIRKKKKFDN